MREKLIELIASKLCGIYSPTCDEWQPHDCGKCFANGVHIADIADHLIANGVIVFPCEVGETVYVIRECSCHVKENRENGRWKCSQKVFLGKRLRAYHCGYVSEAKFDLKHIADFGKKVFLTREEAEAVLQKMKVTEEHKA